MEREWGNQCSMCGLHSKPKYKAIHFASAETHTRALRPCSAYRHVEQQELRLAHRKKSKRQMWSRVCSVNEYGVRARLQCPLRLSLFTCRPSMSSLRSSQRVCYTEVPSGQKKAEGVTGAAARSHKSARASCQLSIFTHETRGDLLDAL